MARDYSLPTIKTLFFEASGCAYPGCLEPLVFYDRGVHTVVGQIAHIRSEKPNGPRYDPGYRGDLNGVENLLLLCGKHHRPVDMHESLYTVEELEEWKAAQRAAAGAGIEISDSEARAFARLSDEERTAIGQIARLSERVVAAGERALAALRSVEMEYGADLQKLQGNIGPVYEVDDQGGRKNITSRIEMSAVDKQKWRVQAEASLEPFGPLVDDAVSTLREEVAVLRMMSGGDLSRAATAVAANAQAIRNTLGDRPRFEQAVSGVNLAVSELWQVANGEAPPKPDLDLP